MTPDGHEHQDHEADEAALVDVLCCPLSEPTGYRPASDGKAADRVAELFERPQPSLVVGRYGDGFPHPQPRLVVLYLRDHALQLSVRHFQPRQRFGYVGPHRAYVGGNGLLLLNHRLNREREPRSIHGASLPDRCYGWLGHGTSRGVSSVRCCIRRFSYSGRGSARPRPASVRRAGPSVPSVPHEKG